VEFGLNAWQERPVADPGEGS